MTLFYFLGVNLTVQFVSIKNQNINRKVAYIVKFTNNKVVNDAQK